jgi:hypothetical protein
MYFFEATTFLFDVMDGIFGVLPDTSKVFSG